MIERIKIRLNITDTTKDTLLNELITSACDSIMLRVGVTVFPRILESIAVETVIAMYNRLGSEGLESERIDVITNDFINDLLEPYQEQLESFKVGLKDIDENATGAGTGGVIFY
ncbi:phage gp6-like head-tail connector protein [Gottschalkia purinilytica]|uniref:Phage gp6-like head-tail connector protein n=1 Tax=Gottschalkia purinilytica TaxID=1503 RepID=A0A0L0WCY3_GOTPU|nr:phage head-tail connector protein [Gottschalkia purinilytica]KNF09306.1 phage gp6-like head-tail connector protein [Gottschalkia purinilytica]